MANIIKRITKRLKYTYNTFINDLPFSHKLAFYRLVDDLAHRIGLNNLAQKAHSKKEKAISDYLKKYLRDIIDLTNNTKSNGCYSENAPIWVCWWTGEEDAPQIVKKCIQSIRLNSNGHKVLLINKSNFCDYLDIPDYILEKVNSQKMCIANFSDYLRFSLLEKYGGLWLDATIYVSDTISDSYFTTPYFTCKSEVDYECRYISRLRWTAFVQGGFIKSPLFTFMKRSLEKYWSEHNSAIDYLLVDYLIELAYVNCPKIKDLIDNVPLNNLHRDDLQSAMNNAMPAEIFNEIIQNDTLLYKLSWREEYKTRTNENKETIYSFFLNFSEHI